MPLLNHLICQGRIMVRATCRTADQTPSRVSGERSVTQNKRLEKTHIIIMWRGRCSIGSTGIKRLTCFMLILHGGHVNRNIYLDF